MNVCHVHYLYYTMLLFKKYCFVLNLFIYYYSIVTSLCCDLIESMPMTVHVKLDQSFQWQCRLQWLTKSLFQSLGYIILHALARNFHWCLEMLVSKSMQIWKYYMYMTPLVRFCLLLVCGPRGWFTYHAHDIWLGT